VDFAPPQVLGVLRLVFQKVPWLLLTATLNPTEQLVVCESLGIDDPFEMRGSTLRSNLQYVVVPAGDQRTRLQQVSAVVFAASGADADHDHSIIYVASRTGTETLAERLRAQAPPHAQARTRGRINRRHAPPSPPTHRRRRPHPSRVAARAGRPRDARRLLPRRPLQRRQGRPRDRLEGGADPSLRLHRRVRHGDEQGGRPTRAPLGPEQERRCHLPGAALPPSTPTRVPLGNRHTQPLPRSIATASSLCGGRSGCGRGATGSPRSAPATSACPRTSR
jgi:hypothetical protein